ncbi:lysophospholipid acyltransferase family protein [Pseudahrensia aquimaris]|uniref:Lysophospholipid acyltransferase family protein n=1 Tax=Pseudahrensia aquimaris TaxID=744461 RepID=A0ABW3FF13_9HYPH
MRSFLFRIAYWATSITVGLVAMPLMLLPGRHLLVVWLRTYAKMMLFWMRVIGGIHLEVRGRYDVPKGGAIIASKHQSWGDGYATFAQFHDLAIVTGDHLAKVFGVGWILKKMEAIVVDNCGGAKSRERLVDEELARAREKGRRILIYPEGRLCPVGYHYRYRKGIFHMYEAYKCPVVPVATNLGLFWPLDNWEMRQGTAVLEFLEPIEPGLDKETFMALLQERIETASIALLPDGFKLPSNRLLPDEFDAEKDPLPEDIETKAA